VGTVRIRVGGDFAELSMAGVALPSLEAEVDDQALPYLLRIKVEVVHGKPVCTALEATRRPGGMPVTRRGLNSLPVERLVRIIAAQASWQKSAGPGHVTYDLIAGDDERAKVRHQLEPRRGRRPDPATHDDLIRQAVRAYRELLPTTMHPKPHIAAELNISKSYVAALLREARQRGWLGPAIPGRAGEATEA
jgi:hypothetical protein